MATNKIQTGIRLQSQSFEKLDKYAEKLQISRNQLMENLINSGLDDLHLLDKFGMLVVGTGFRNLVKQLRESDDGQQALID